MTLAPIILAVGAGLVVGLVRGGRLASIARTHVRRPALLAVAIGASLFVDTVDAGPSAAIAAVGLAGGLAFTVVNLHLVGMVVVAIGIAANLVPLALNGAMPVRPEALVEAEMVSDEELPRVVLSGARELADDSTMLAPLGDTFPMRWTNQVVSIGDLIMLVGLAAVVSNLMLQRRRRLLPPGALRALESLGWHEELDLTDPVGPATVDLRAPTGSPRQVDVEALGAAQPESAQPESAQPESAQPESAQPESAPSGRATAMSSASPAHD